MQCSLVQNGSSITCWKDTLVDDGDVNVVALQPLEEAAGRMHAADARCNVQERQHCAGILHTETLTSDDTHTDPQTAVQWSQNAAVAKLGKGPSTLISSLHWHLLRERAFPMKHTLMNYEVLECKPRGKLWPSRLNAMKS